MNLCSQINEELDKSKLSKLVKDVITAIKDESDYFEILDVDGKHTVDSDGELVSEDSLSVEELSDLADFSGLLNEIAEDEDYIKKGDKLSEKEIEAVIKGLKNLDIKRTGTVSLIKAGPSEFEDAGTSEEEFDVTISSFDYDKKKDILKAKKFKG
jgi:hypothetical protein